MNVQQNKLPLSVDTVEWTPETAKQIGLELEGSSPQDLLRWGFENFGPSVVMATGFGPEGIVLMHLVSQIRPETIVFYLDTESILEFHYLNKLFVMATSCGSATLTHAARSVK